MPFDRATRASGHTPRYIIADRGRQFWCGPFKRWCKRRGVRPRYGVLGEPASLCVVERFIRSMKDECTRRLVVVPMSHAAFRKELSAYASWYNRWRPHTTLGGRTPEEAFGNRAAPQRRFETRPLWPRHGALRRDTLRLAVSYVEGRKHLPVIELRRAA